MNKINLEEATLKALANELNTYQEEDKIIKDDVQGIVDGVLVITDPEISTEEYEDIIENAQKIIEDTPEGEIPFDDEYIGQYAQTCPICGSTFVEEQVLEPGATCPICLQQPEAFVVVGKIESDEEEIEEIEEEVTFGTDLNTYQDDTINNTEVEEVEVKRDVASKQISGNKLAEAKVTDYISKEELDKAIKSNKILGLDNDYEVLDNMFIRMKGDLDNPLYKVYKDDDNEGQLMIYLSNRNGEKLGDEFPLKESKNLREAKYGIFILEETEPGVYNSSKVDEVDSEEQAVDRVAELKAETQSDVYYELIEGDKDHPINDNDSIQLPSTISGEAEHTIEDAIRRSQLNEVSKNIETKSFKIGNNKVELEIEDGNHISKIYWTDSKGSTDFNYDEKEDKFTSFNNPNGNFMTPIQERQLKSKIKKLLNKDKKQENKSNKYLLRDLGLDPYEVDYSKNKKAKSIYNKFAQAKKLDRLFDYLAAGLTEPFESEEEYLKYFAGTDISDYEIYNGKLNESKDDTEKASEIDIEQLSNASQILNSIYDSAVDGSSEFYNKHRDALATICDSVDTILNDARKSLKEDYKKLEEVSLDDIQSKAIELGYEATHDDRDEEDKTILIYRKSFNPNSDNFDDQDNSELYNYLDNIDNVRYELDEEDNSVLTVSLQDIITEAEEIESDEEKIKLTLVTDIEGNSDAYYRDKNNKAYCLEDGNLYTCDPEYGEPDKLLDKTKYEFDLVEDSSKLKDQYSMLDRLESDCKYFLGNGDGYEGHLWAKNVDDQIAKMKEIWNAIPENKKPEWLTMEQIDEYAKKMRAKKASRGKTIRKVTSYFDEKLQGVEDSLETEDDIEIRNFIWKKLNDGNYVKLENAETGEIITYKPEDIEEIKNIK